MGLSCALPSLLKSALTPHCNLPASLLATPRDILPALRASLIIFNQFSACATHNTDSYTRRLTCQRRTFLPAGRHWKNRSVIRKDTPRISTFTPKSSLSAEMASSPNKSLTRSAKQSIAFFAVSGLSCATLHSMHADTHELAIRVPLGAKEVIHISKHRDFNQVACQMGQRCANSLPCMHTCY